MADREPPYDPYIPSGGAAPGGSAAPSGNQRTAALQAVSPPRSLPGSGSRETLPRSYVISLCLETRF